MNIGYFITKFPYSQSYENYLYGGATMAAYYLANEMAERGHKIYIFTTSRNSRESIEKHENMIIYRYGTKFKFSNSNISFGFFRKPLSHDVNIIHTHFDIPPGPLAGLRYAKKKKVPLLITYHGDWIEGYGGIIRRTSVAFHNKYLVNKILSSAKLIISPSKYYIEESRFLVKFKNKIIVIPNGINLNEFDNAYTKEECREKLELPYDKTILLFLGYLSPHKGPDVLIRALQKIVIDVPDVLLVIVGTGVMQDKLKALSRKLGVEKNVRFEGFIGDIHLKTLYYKAADIFCVPSLSEIFGIVNLEAMACGIPIVASKVDGIPDVVKNGENGLLVRSKDSKALADAIIYLIENKRIRDMMGLIGRERVKDYSWTKIAEEMERIYGDLLLQA
jgi:glycosyltransferase involved in cell wall biosynthesis